ncbi:MAG: phospholipase D-like domain-containing protein [bacterium]
MKTKIQILSNTNYPLADVLKSEFLESKNVKIAVAFLRKTGIDKIQKALDYALSKNDANIEFIVGLDFKTTDHQALIALNEIKSNYKGFNYYCFGDKRDNYNDLIFHPKIYLFDNQDQKNPQYTSIIGSSNLTGGGLSSNFEVNSIFRESEPKYFTQLSAIYNEIKFTDSIFIPNKEYLNGYGDIKKSIEKSGKQIEKGIKRKIDELRNQELILPGTVPTMKKIIIDIIKSKIENGLKEIPLELIYEESEKIVKEKNYNFKMDTFRSSLRGELNRNEKNSTNPENMYLFIRTKRGNYSLTDNGYNYVGR